MNDNNTQYAKKLREQIDTLNKENRYLEFKSNYQDPEKLGKYISALSNGACLDRQDYGYLYFGVEDITLNVKGTTFDISQKAKGNQPLELYLHQYISPKIDFTIEEFFYEKSIRMVRFKIQAARREPTCFKGTPYVRVDSSLTELKQYVEWLRNIYNSDEDWSEKVIPNASLDDLDKEAIKIVRNGYNLRNPEYVEELSQWSDKVFLDKANLTKTEKSLVRQCYLSVGKKVYTSWSI